MVPDLVGDDVGAREVARRAEALAELAEELEVEIHLPVRRAVEGTDRGAGLAARGVDRPAEEHQARRLVGPAALLEEPTPGVLDVPEHRANEIRLGIVRRRLPLRSAVDGRRRGVLEAAEEIQRIRAREDAQHQDQEQPAAPELQPRPPTDIPRRSSTLSLRRRSPPAHREPPGPAVRASGLHLKNAPGRGGAATGGPSRAWTIATSGRPLYRRPGGSSKISAVSELLHVNARPSRLRDRAGTVPALLQPGAPGPRTAGRRARGDALRAGSGRSSARVIGPTDST